MVDADNIFGFLAAMNNHVKHSCPLLDWFFECPCRGAVVIDQMKVSKTAVGIYVMDWSPIVEQQHIQGQQTQPRSTSHASPLIRRLLEHAVCWAH